MSPSSTFNPRVMVEVDNLSLQVRLPTFHVATVRDGFVNLAKNPLGTLSSLRSPRHQMHSILENVSFVVNQGDRVAILGVNGVGKSTLCRCLTGRYNPTGGSVRRFGQIRGVFDTAVGIYPDLTGRENARVLMHFLYPEMIDRHEEMIAEALEFSELERFLDSPYRVYSNGMQARLCLSLISCQPSDVLILDEVFDGADKFFREKISARILSIIEKSGSVVFVSHSAEQLLRVCNRAIVLNNGHLEFDGDILEGLKFYSQLKVGEGWHGH